MIWIISALILTWIVINFIIKERKNIKIKERKEKIERERAYDLKKKEQQERLKELVKDLIKVNTKLIKDIDGQYLNFKKHKAIKINYTIFFDKI